LKEYLKMAIETPGRKGFGDIAPAFADYTDRVLFGEIWERPELSKRDRSLITVATLIALYRVNELPSHLKRAIANGRDEGRIDRSDHPSCFLCRLAGGANCS
jgi:4-carboxymuconolactone decarboxylase